MSCPVPEKRTNRPTTYLADLRDHLTQENRLWGLLSCAEKARADRYRVPLKRTTFILGRGILRDLLGRWLRRDPASLAFSENPHGKPLLSGDTGSSAGNLHFNLSHSGHYLLIGICEGRELGVDLQEMHPQDHPEVVSRKVFSPQENRALAGLKDQAYRDRFYQFWVWKEAYLKGLGAGFHISPQEINLLPEPAGPARPWETSVVSPEGVRWSIRDLPAPPGYRAAAAAPGFPAELPVKNLAPQPASFRGCGQ